MLTIRIKRTHIEVTYHLTKAEVDTLIAAPDPKTPRGRREGQTEGVRPPEAKHDPRNGIRVDPARSAAEGVAEEGLGDLFCLRGREGRALFPSLRQTKSAAIAAVTL
ncbi:hypothetical protein X759_28000 [Mesorhizobium sp. LSHC420B00]|nr:hypothetical protein X759_28000 [Mesorhizobium sp. LSHC420B00]